MEIRAFHNGIYEGFVPELIMAFLLSSIAAGFNLRKGEVWQFPFAG
jgi:hypothetical protein